MSPADAHDDQSYLQLRLGYHGQTAMVIREFFSPLQKTWAQQHFYAWRLARSWQHGPHWLLTLDTRDPFFAASMQAQLADQSACFLKANPSPPYEAEKQLSLQRKLNALENSAIDDSVLIPNNSTQMARHSASALAKRYESVAQWRTVFEADVRLLPFLLRMWCAEQEPDHSVFELMMVLACVFPPQPIDNREMPLVTGFLSYHSNYLFWRHSLPVNQRALLDERFERDYASDTDKFKGWLDALVPKLQAGVERVCRTSVVLLDHFLLFTRMAREGLIHARSPFPRDQLAPVETVSDFHRQHFYKADGKPYEFSDAFAGYRWLLNVIYRNLPLLEVAPLRRQYLNYSLARLQEEQSTSIAQLRTALLALR